MNRATLSAFLTLAAIALGTSTRAAADPVITFDDREAGLWNGAPYWDELGQGLKPEID